MSFRLLLAAFSLVFAMALPASAHRLNETYVYFTVTDTSLAGRVEVRLPDLEVLIGLDADGNGEVTKEEFSARSQEAFAAFDDRLFVRHDDVEHEVVFGEYDFLDTPQGIFAQLQFTVPTLGPTPDSVVVLYRSPFQDSDPSHLGYGLIESNTRTGVVGNESVIAAVFQPDRDMMRISLVGDPPWTIFLEFVVHGIWHIWLGFDHVVFLVALLLPAVLRVKDEKWRPAETFSSAFWTVLKIVTAFTLSHSVTLTLAGLEVISLPVSLVEAVIALSIIIVGVMNLFPKLHKYTLAVVLAFGLFHGFGFANVLAPLGVQPSAKVIGLAAFNIGVELGQVAIVVVLFPILFAVRGLSIYPRLAIQGASVVFIVLAIVWFIERSSGFFWRLQQQILASMG